MVMTNNARHAACLLRHCDSPSVSLGLSHSRCMIPSLVDVFLVVLSCDSSMSKRRSSIIKTVPTMHAGASLEPIAWLTFYGPTNSFPRAAVKAVTAVWWLLAISISCTSAQRADSWSSWTSTWVLSHSQKKFLGERTRRLNE